MRLFFTIYLCLIFLFLPFHFELIPNLGEILFKMFSPIFLWCAEHILFLQTSTLVDASDSAAMYGMLLTSLTFSIGLFGFVHFQLKKSEKTIQQILTNALIYILALFLLFYGIDKLTLNQFYVPRPNTLHTELGDLSKDIAFWSVMGSSKIYQLFMGSLEVIPGILLLFRRTRFFALIIAFGVLLNVLFINIGFDISVKILSTILLFTCLLLLSEHRNKIHLILGFRTVEVETENSIDLPLNAKKIIKASVLFLIGIELIFHTNVSLMAAESNDRDSSSYEIISLESDLSPFKGAVRIHFHPAGYLISESREGQFKDYRLSRPMTNQFFILKDNGTSYQIERDNASPFLILFDNEGNAIAHLRKINNEMLPLLQDDFHLTVESFKQP